MSTRRSALTRRRLLYLGVAGAAATVLPGLGGAADAATLPSDADRAVAAYKAQQKNLYAADGTGLYRETAPQSGNPYSYLWPFSQACEGTLDLYKLGLVPLADVQDRYRHGLPQYRDGASSPPGYDSYVLPPSGAGGDKFYDDNAWVGLSLLRTNRLTGDATTLGQAQEVYAFLAGGWDANPADPYPGGVFWKQQTATEANHDRNTVSTAPSAELALRLYQRTGQQAYLDWGKRAYDWVNASLRDADGLYFDHVRGDGTRDTTKWSYNQGTMVGANVLLYQLYRTSDPTAAAGYLAQAKAIAGAALAYFGRVGYFGQDPAFNAIFWRNLLFLAAVDTTYLAATKQAMQAYADTTWTNNRHGNNLFYFPANATAAKLVNQAAMVEIYACLAWSAADYDLLVV